MPQLAQAADTAHQHAHVLVDQIQSLYIQGQKALDKNKLEVLVGTYLWETDLVLRCKGQFVANDQQKMMLQGVGTLFEFRNLPEPQDGVGFCFLFVGRGIDEQKLKKEIDECAL